MPGRNMTTPKPPRAIPATLLAGAVVLGGCAAGGGTGESGGNAGAPLGPAHAMPTQGAGQYLFAATENGLEVHQWRFADEPATFAAVVPARGDDAFIEPDTREALARNGFRLIRLAPDQTAALRRDLGGVLLEREGWHGQALTWRPIASRPVGDDLRAVAVDGRVRVLERGALHLMLRGWTLQMEDGPAVHLEILPVLDRTKTTRFDQVIGRRVDVEPFDDMRIEVLLDPGSAYVLTCAAPDAQWGSADARIDARLGDDGGGGGRAAVGPGVGLGPDVETPATVGEALMRIGGPSPTREVFVLLPRVAPYLYPPNGTLESAEPATPPVAPETPETANAGDEQPNGGASS